MSSPCTGLCNWYAGASPASEDVDFVRTTGSGTGTLGRRTTGSGTGTLDQSMPPAAAEDCPPLLSAVVQGTEAAGGGAAAGERRGSESGRVLPLRTS